MALAGKVAVVPAATGEWWWCSRIRGNDCKHAWRACNRRPPPRPPRRLPPAASALSRTKPLAPHPRTGIVGGGIAKIFLEEGATVIAPARSAGSQAKITAALSGVGAPGALHTLIADHSTLAGAQALADYIKANVPGGQVDTVISIAGGEVEGGAQGRRCARDTMLTRSFLLLLPPRAQAWPPPAC